MSCGSRGMISVPFQELTSVYDNFVWLAVLTTDMGLSQVISLGSPTAKPSDKINHFISFMKVLLEQGDPFSEMVLSCPKVRVALGSFLLVGIILSNAYKNTNVYNMIAPRGLLPFETIKELEQYNFTVYTRSMSIDHESTMWPAFSICDGVVVKSDVSMMRYCIKSEVRVAAEKYLGLVLMRGFEQFEYLDQHTLQLATKLVQSGVLDRAILSPVSKPVLPLFI